MIGQAYSVRQPEVTIDGMTRPTVYANMRVGALYTRIYVICTYEHFASGQINKLIDSLRKYAYI